MLSNESIQGLAKLAANYPSTWAGDTQSDTASRLHQGGWSVYGNNVKGLSGGRAIASGIGSGAKSLYNMLPARETMQRDQGHVGALLDTYFGGPGSGFDVGLNNMYRAPGGVIRTVGGGLAAGVGGQLSLLPSGYGGDTGTALRDSGVDMVMQGGGQYLDAISGDMTSSAERSRADAQRSMDRANTQMQQLQNRDLSAGEQAQVQAADLTTDIAASVIPFVGTGGIGGAGTAANAANAAKTTGIVSKAIPAVGRADAAVRNLRAVQASGKALQATKGVAKNVVNQATKPVQALTRTSVPGLTRVRPVLNATQRPLQFLELGALASTVPEQKYQEYRDTMLTAPGTAAPGATEAVSRMAPNANSSYRFYNDPGVQTPTQLPVSRNPRSMDNPYARAVAQGQQPTPATPSQLPVSRDPRSIMNPYGRAVEAGKQPGPVAPRYRSRRQHAIKKGPNEGQSQFLSRARKQYNDTVSRRSTRAAEFVKNRPELFGNK